MSADTALIGPLKGMVSLENTDNIAALVKEKERSIGLTKENSDLEKIKKFLDFVSALARTDLVQKNTTCMLMQEMLDSSPVTRCVDLFNVVEDMITIWKEPFFFDTCKNQVLRMCNDLLKRLSRTVDTAFCGRVLIFLAKTLPLEEKSGLNLVSQFNVANVTTFEEKKEEELEIKTEQEDMEVGEIIETKESLNYEFYSKFWSLQSCFCSPCQLFNQDKFKAFQQDMNLVFEKLSSQKVERLNSEDQSKLDAEAGPAFFSAKYLTSNKLFQLQLSDSQFRRYFLVQCLVTFEFLLNNTKTKEKLSSEQDKTIKELTERALSLIKETYPHGSSFAYNVRKILQSDREWATWKASGCPPLVSGLKLEDVNHKNFQPRQLTSFEPNIVDLGNAELTRLWTQGADNLTACKKENRTFEPKLAQVLEDALDELDPEQQVDDEYKSIYDEKYQWSTSRLLLKNSIQYLNVNQNAMSLNVPKIPKTAEFLQNALISASDTIPELRARTKTVTVALKALEERKRAEDERRKEEEEVRAREAALAAKARREREKAEREAAEAAAPPVAGPATPPALARKPEPGTKRPNPEPVKQEPKKSRPDKSAKRKEDKEKRPEKKARP